MRRSLLHWGHPFKLLISLSSKYWKWYCFIHFTPLWSLDQLTVVNMQPTGDKYNISLLSVRYLQWTGVLRSEEGMKWIELETICPFTVPRASSSPMVFYSCLLVPRDQRHCFGQSGMWRTAAQDTGHGFWGCNDHPPGSHYKEKEMVISERGLRPTLNLSE